MKHLFYKVGIVLTGLFMACSPNSELSEDTKTTNTDVPKGMTTFGGTQQTNKPVTRTSIKHLEVGVASNPFYWEVNDKLWVKKDNTLLKSSSSDITDKAATARFFFNGLFEATQYDVYYRGTNDNATANNVVIAANQVQTQPNSSKHFGASGDCGTATATRGGDGIYRFSLQHKAAYLCFIPRMTDTGLGANTVLKQVKIVSETPIAGTYDFSTGELTTPANTSKEITVKCGDTGFPLTGSSSADALAKAGVYAVIAPGNYKLRIEYTVADKTNNVEGILYQYIDTHPFSKNTLTDIVVDLNTRIIDLSQSQSRFYAWDATQNRFATSDKVANQTEGYTTAQNSAKDNPNINETMWYLQKGDAMIEKDVLYKKDNHLLKGVGLWLKQKQYISGFNKEQAPDGQDYRNIQYNSGDVNCKNGRPTDPSLYFFLPAWGDVADGGIRYEREAGAYWTSSGTPRAGTQNHLCAYSFSFWDTGYGIYGSNNYAERWYGYPNWIGK